LRKYLRYDYKAYLLCLVTAACFWVLNAMGGEFATDINYPVHFVPDSTSSPIEKGSKVSVAFNASGTGWELLKRSLFFKFSPAEIPLSTVQGEHVVPASRLLGYLVPNLGKLKINHLITDSIEVESKVILQKKVFLSLNTEKLKLQPPYRISSKIYLEPDYITVDGPSADILAMPDTLELTIKNKIIKGVDTLLDLKSIISHKLSVDYNEAHLLFDVAPFGKREKTIQATLIGFPDSLEQVLSKPEFKVEYFVQEEYFEIEKKAKYKIILDYNMIDNKTHTLVPVLLDFPDYIRDYTITPAVFSLQHAK
jgi:hypothetical protein